MAEADTVRNGYGTHQRTYHRFLHLLKWFTFHVAVIIAGLYFLIVDPAPVLGFALILVGVVVLGYGIARTDVVAQKRYEARLNRAEQGRS